MLIIKQLFEADGAGGGGAPEPTPAPAPEPTPEPTPAPAPTPASNVFDAVPEEYAFNLGEGLTISDEQKTAFTAIAKEANMTQAQVDAVLKMHSDIMLDAIRQAEDQRNEWAKECGKQGLLTQQNIGYAKKCIETFGGSEAMQALVDTGAANHPAVQKMLQKIGALISEDNGAGGDKPAQQQVSDADLMFPNSQYK